jgi:Domain of unknown function (DU1801)
MPEAKTKPTKASVKDFLASVENETRRKDARVIAKLMAEVTGEKPYMLGSSIVGYGAYQSPTGTWPIVGFSPRKANLVLYVLAGAKEQSALLKKLGKHKTGKSCLYINKLADVNEAVLRDLVMRSVQRMKEKYS